MKGSIATFVFLASFLLNVRVKADSPPQAFQEPDGCLAKILNDESSVPCGVRAKEGSRYTFSREQAKITLGSKSAVLVQPLSRTRYLAGDTLIEAGNESEVSTEFGLLKLDSGTQALLKRGSGKVWVVVLKGEVLVKPRGSSEQFVIREGFENWLGGVDQQGIATSGRPLAANFRETVVIWSRLTELSKPQFFEKVEEFSEIWKVASEKSAELHSELYHRKLAAVEEHRRKKAAAAARVEAERREIRELFRSRVLFPF